MDMDRTIDNNTDDSTEQPRTRKRRRVALPHLLVPVNGKLVMHPDAKLSRDQLRAENRCINGPRDPQKTKGLLGVEHGKVVSGGKCQRCIDVWKKSR